MLWEHDWEVDKYHYVKTNIENDDLHTPHYIPQARPISNPTSAGSNNTYQPTTHPLPVQ